MTKQPGAEIRFSSKGSGGSRFMLVISIKTLYGGHSKQAAMVASHCHADAYNNRWTIVVDDDPTNFSARPDVLRHRDRPA
ncbi:MAG: UbiD family decarboxylase [Alphaproteobacteria bacterium]|nr:MAG: UbiD family decarboxylase [Alphaproteobacteria bacterium]TMJ94544.1 MAG: UbiD family decarboxylase [Alphaproteobacteria bacterium]TMJ95673.1 MAG: UbiD family decarboxylase [Alphaproteobacteria bacterium]